MNKLTVKDLPNIVRVNSYEETRREVELHGKLPHEWKYIGNADQIKGYELKEGITYYIDYDVPELEIMLRIR